MRSLLPSLRPSIFTSTFGGFGLGDRLWDVAGLRPSLDLQLATRKSLVDAVTGASLVTFTRASSGTFVDSAGVLQTAATDVPRFDHNPTTGESLGLLVEEQRTNLRTYSDAILAANSYGATNSTLATVTTATPTGSATASSFTMNVGANTGNNTDGFNFGSGVTLVNSTQYTQSLFVKPAGATVLRLRSNTGGAIFDFTLTGNGTAPSPSADLQAASIVAFPNGWYRVSWTFTSTTSAPGNRGDYWTIKTNVADGTNGVYVVGAQLEAGAFPTSYIPTTTAAATRNADVASITGSAFSGWYRQGEGTMFVECALAQPNAGANQFAFRASDNTLNNSVAINIVDSARIATAAGGVFDGNASSVLALVANVPSKIAGAYASNNLGISLNGATTVTDATATIPTSQTRADIGSDHIGANRVKAGTIKRLTYWPTRLANSTLQGITQ